jgi:glycosyltransferase involved in cell wall biosynthesis
MIYWTGDASNQPCLENFGHPALQENVDRVFCVSKWHRDSFIRKFGLDPEKVIATRNGFSSSLLCRGPRNAYRCAYTSTPFRGLEILLKIFPEIRRHRPTAVLDVFSSMKVYGWSSEEDRKSYGAIYDAANQDGVTWHGSVSQPDLFRSLTQTGLLLYPNTFDETSCIAAIEAQAAGCVVITSARAGLKETVAHGETGICIPGEPQTLEYQRTFVDAVLGVMSNPELFARLSAAARTRARGFYSWDLIAAEWTRVFEQMPAQPVSGRFSGPLSLLERTNEYLLAGNREAARRVLSNVERTPFFKREAEGLRAAALMSTVDERGA